MEKMYGAEERNDGIVLIGTSTWEIYYGIFEDSRGRFLYHAILPFRPTVEHLRSMVLEAANDYVQERIVSGFRWNDMPVWLSEANQLNYARDFAVAYYCEKNGEQYSLPTYKFGTDETPIYYTFETFEEFKQFCKAWALHISDTVRAGWREKAAIDWDKYNPANARHL